MPHRDQGRNWPGSEGSHHGRKIPSAYLVSIYDTERKQMLWNRADSNIEPSAYEHSSPVLLRHQLRELPLSTWLREMTGIWAMNLMPAQLTLKPPLQPMKAALQPGNATKLK